MSRTPSPKHGHSMKVVGLTIRKHCIKDSKEVTWSGYNFADSWLGTKDILFKRRAMPKLAPDMKHNECKTDTVQSYYWKKFKLSIMMFILC